MFILVGTSGRRQRWHTSIQLRRWCTSHHDCQIRNVLLWSATTNLQLNDFRTTIVCASIEICVWLYRKCQIHKRTTKNTENALSENKWAAMTHNIFLFRAVNVDAVGCFFFVYLSSWLRACVRVSILCRLFFFKNTGGKRMYVRARKKKSRYACELC